MPGIRSRFMKVWPMPDAVAANPIVCTVPFDADGKHHGFLRLPYSRNDSAWGSVMIPISVVAERRGTDRAAHRWQPWRRIRGTGGVSTWPASSTGAIAGRVIIVPSMNTPAFRAATGPRRSTGATSTASSRAPTDGHREDRRLFPRTLLPMADSCSTSIRADGRWISCPSRRPTGCPTGRRRLPRRAAGVQRALFDGDAGDRRCRHVRHRRRGYGQDLRHHRARRWRHRDRARPASPSAACATS